MDYTREELEQSNKLRAEQLAKYGCDLCPTDENCRECLDPALELTGGRPFFFGGPKPIPRIPKRFDATSGRTTVICYQLFTNPPRSSNYGSSN